MAKLIKIKISQAAKFSFVYYLVMMAFFMLPLAVVMMLLMGMTSNEYIGPRFMGIGVGVFVIVIMPFYAVMVAVMVAIMSGLYNLVAKWVGGIEVEVTQ